MPTINLTIWRGQRDFEVDIEVEVEYAYNPAHRGAREPGTGLALEPDDPADIQLVGAVETSSRMDVDLTPSEEEEAIEAAWRDVQERRQEAAEARADVEDDR